MSLARQSWPMPGFIERPMLFADTDGERVMIKNDLIAVTAFSIIFGCASRIHNSEVVSVRDRTVFSLSKQAMMPEKGHDPKAINTAPAIYFAYEQLEDREPDPNKKMFFGNYLTLNLPFPPVEDLRMQLEKWLMETRQVTGPLRHRGEAHITVLTPPEYVLNMQHRSLLVNKETSSPRFLKMNEILEITRAGEFLQPQLEPVCIGRGSATISGKTEHTYFIVIKPKSPTIMNIRKKIDALYVKKGGDAADFEPENFFPHVTLGYTLRDLHESDGVYKDARSCIAKVEIR